MASVAGVSGRADKLVTWVKRAWEDVQNQREWNFLKGEFEATLTAGARRYTASSFNIERFKRWETDTPFFQPVTLYDPAIGQSDETALRQVPYDVWRTRYDRGVHDQNRPTVYAVCGSGDNICFGPTPDKTYTVRGGYRKSPQILSGNTDVPEAPEHLHQIIVHRAMVLMGAGDESPVTVTFAQNEYRRLFAAMCEECLPHVDMSRGNTLA